MSLLSQILGRRWHLPRAQTHDVVCERDLRIEMDDGAVLLADRWVARAALAKPQPTVLVRSCYGRRGFFGLLNGRLLAERGLQVVMQSVRGTFGSEGTFNPFDERAWIAGEDRLVWEPPAAGTGGSCGYRYDPADPTPAFGGPIMVTSKPVRDNRPLEKRADVLTFTTPPLEEVVEAIGAVRVQLWARGSEPHFDLFARVCDVDPAGASWNVCDALASVAPDRFEQSDGAWRVQFDLWPIAHRFAAGNRIRLQVSSGAHPRYVRNPGTGEDPLTADQLRAVDVELLYGPERSSSVLLPPSAPANGSGR